MNRIDQSKPSKFVVENEQTDQVTYKDLGSCRSQLWLEPILGQANNMRYLDSQFCDRVISGKPTRG